MNDPIDPRDLRTLYGGHERRAEPREDESPALTVGRLLSAYTAAEESYYSAIARPPRGLVGAPRMIAIRNAKAEGLAEAVSIFTGVPVEEIRAKNAERWRARRDERLSGLARARASLGGQVFAAGSISAGQTFPVKDEAGNVIGRGVTLEDGEVELELPTGTVRGLAETGGIRIS